MAGQFKPSLKQYKALMYLGAIPASEEREGERVPLLDSDGNQTFDMETTEVGYGGAAGGGKIVGENGQVMTPRGWKKGKDLNIGDIISGADGLPQKIIGITPRMRLPKWRVSFSDGTFTDVAEGHLWTARKARESVRKGGKRFFGEESAEVVETKELRNWLLNSKGTRGVPLIPVNDEVFFDQSNSKKTRIDPYLLGALLGDGCITGSSSNMNITIATADLQHRKDLLQIKDVSYLNHGGSYQLNFIGEFNSELIYNLKKYGLYGTYSDTKFIPDAYKYSSIEKRYELVRGLMDTDGNKKKDGYSAYYYTTSKQLSDDMAFVLRSLGAVVTITDRIGKYKKDDGTVVNCKRFYTLHIKHREPDLLFSMDRKKLGLKRQEINKRVVSVEQLDEQIRGRCITVSNPNGLYITDDFIVTHNSYLGCQWLYMMCKRYPGTRWFMAREELKKLKESTLLTMFGVLQSYGEEDKKTYGYNNISGRIKFENGSEIFLVGLKDEPSDPMFTRFGSMEFTGGFIDEANECPSKGYEILQTRIRYKLESFCPHCAGALNIDDKVGEDKTKNPDPTGKDDEWLEHNVYSCPKCGMKSHGLSPKILSTFNPDKGWVFTKFYKPFTEGKQLSNVKFIPALVTDNEFIPKAYIANLRRMKDKVSKERLLYGNFDYDNSPGRLFDYDEVLEIFDRQLESEKLKTKYKTDPDYKVEVDTLGKIWQTGYEHRITCDPARHGRDLAVIMLWNKLSIEEIYVYHYSDITELESRIKLLWDKYGIGPLETLVDDDGVGCLVPGTEVMCVDGWKKVEDLVAGDMVFSKDKDGNVIHDEIVRVAKKEGMGILDDGNLAFSRGQYTPIKTRKEYKYKCAPFDGIVKKSAIMLDNEFKRKGKSDDFIIPEQSIIMPHGGKKVIKPERKIKLKDFSAFLGWYCSEGNLDRYDNKNYINITQSVKSVYNDNISGILDRCGFTWSTTKSKAGVYKYVFADKWLCDWIEENCYVKADVKNAWYKKVPQVVKDATPEVIKEYLIAYNEGDGYIEKKTENRIYGTSSIVMRDDLLELIYKMGGYGRCYIHSLKGSESEIFGRKIIRKRDVWRVAEFKKTSIGYRNDKEYVERLGDVYDIRLKGDVKLYPIRFTTGNMKYKMFWTHNGGLVDALKCRGFINRAAPIQPKKASKDPLKRMNYQTIKDQCYFELANHINEIAVTSDNMHVFGSSVSAEMMSKGKQAEKISHEQIIKNIIEEIDAIVEIDIDIDGPKKVIKKKEMKAKIGRSPDFGDAIMMRMYWEIKKPKKVFVYSG